MSDLTVDNFIEWYGDGAKGQSPTRQQWARILDRDEEKSVSLINFFKFREVADYSGSAAGPDESTSGADAFARYSSVSMPTMGQVGGEFVYIGQYQGGFLGPEETWDLIVVGRYPNLAALIQLYSNENYRAAFAHRVAACERQVVLIGGE